MSTNSLPNRKYPLKKASYAAALNTVIILAMMVLTVVALVAYFEGNTFIPSLHTPLLIVIVGMAIFAYYVKMPPPYVKLVDGEIKVKKYFLGGWKSAALKNLQNIEVRGNVLYMAFSEERNRELEVKLDALSFNHARELQELLNKIITR